MAGAPIAEAEEKNGVQLTVQKKTLDRADTRGGAYYLDRIDRTQGLKVMVKNVSFKPMPEGEVEWVILVRKYPGTILEGFRGAEALKALRPADTVEMVMGAAQITGWRDYYDAVRDKMEYQVIVKQEGVEKVRMQSTSNFDTLIKRAQIRVVQPAASNPEPAAPATPSATVNKPPPAPAARPAATPTPRRPVQPQPPPAAPEPPAAPLDGGAVR